MKCGAPEGLCHFPRTLGSFRSPLCWVLARLAFVVIAASLPISPYLSGPPSLQGSTVLTNFAQGMLLICAGAHLHPISQLAAQVPQRYMDEVHDGFSSSCPSSSQPATRRLSFCTTYIVLKTLAGDLLSRALFHTTRGTTPPPPARHYIQAPKTAPPRGEQNLRPPLAQSSLGHFITQSTWGALG